MAKAKKKGKKSKIKFSYPAPKNFKPFFGHLLVRTGKDGLLQDVDFVRFKGKPSNPNAKSIYLSQHDPKTLASIAARIGGTSFVTNPEKRLPSGTVFRMLVRVGQSDGDLRFGVKEILAKKGDKKKNLNKKHPWWKRLRRCTKTMPAAFMSIGDFPKLSKKGKEKDNDDE